MLGGLGVNVGKRGGYEINGHFQCPSGRAKEQERALGTVAVRYESCEGVRETKSARTARNRRRTHAPYITSRNVTVARTFRYINVT